VRLDLTAFSKMAKKRKKSKATKSTLKLGRPEELKIEDLPRRFRDMKLFLENYWGHVGLGLRKARKPDDVTSALKSIPGIEGMSLFRGHAACLIAPKAIETTSNEVRATRRKVKAAEFLELQCWTAYHEATPKAQQATVAFQQVISQFGEALNCFEFFFVVSLIGYVLRVEELNLQVPKLWDAVVTAQKDKNALIDRLKAQEAWFARNEVVEFAKNRRHSKSLLNFARAMAGLPEWGWFHSRRSCETLADDSEQATPYQLFNLIDDVIRKTKPLRLSRVERSVRRELLSSSVGLFLREYVRPQWDYLEEAIRFCEGKNFKRSELTFKIMDRFLYHCERGKSTIDTELAKRNELR
jgi:hypothetical protein